MGLTTKQLHQEKVESAAFWLHRFGYLRNEDLAALMFRGKASGLRLARRLTKEMTDAGLILMRHSVGEAARFALSQKGARLARTITGTYCKTGKDVLRTPSSHRDVANRVAIDAMAAGYTVLTDRELQTTVDRANFGGKVPDCLLMRDEFDGCGHQRNYTWVEVENCKRGGRDLDTLCSWLLRWAFPNRQGYIDSYRDGYLAEVLFVISSPKAYDIQGRVTRRMEEMLKDDPNGAAWIRDHAPTLIRSRAVK